MPFQRIRQKARKASFGFACMTALLIASACSEAVDPSAPERTLTGNWGSDGGNGGALALTESNGAITGHGWLKEGPASIVVTGTRHGKEVLLDVVSARNGFAMGKFRGEFSNDILVGDFGSAYRVSLVRVDTVASAIARITHPTGSTPLADRAFFSLSATGLGIQMGGVFAPLVLIFAPPRRLEPGSYEIGERGVAQFSGLFEQRFGNTGSETLPSVSGTLTITVSSKRALIGSFSIRFAAGSVTRDVVGNFSAACEFDYLQPTFQTCMPAK